jgi:hypothetical protein
MNQPPAFKLLSDAPRNLLRVWYVGRVDPAAMRACRAQATERLGDLRPGFAVLTDLSALDAMDVECVTELAQLLEQFRAAGVRTVVRIIPDKEKDIGFNILSIIHLRRGVRVVTCETAAEAEAALATHHAGAA